MKEELIEYLKTKDITTVLELWGHAKTYYKDKRIGMGGSYASFGDDISITLSTDKALTRFKVRLEDCN